MPYVTVMPNLTVTKKSFTDHTDRRRQK